MSNLKNLKVLFSSIIKYITILISWKYAILLHSFYVQYV